MSRARTSVVATFCSLVMLFASCSSDGTEEPDSQPEPRNTGEIVSIAASADVVRLQASPNDRAGNPMLGELALASSSAIGLSFPRPTESLARDCIQHAEVRLGQVTSLGPPDAAASLYASSMFNLHRLESGDEWAGPRQGTLVDNRPRADLNLPAEDGWRAWDVTTLTKLWLSHGRFPSEGKRIPKRAPLVVELRPADAQATWTRVFASSESPPETTPELRITHDCT